MVSLFRMMSAQAESIERATAGEARYDLCMAEAFEAVKVKLVTIIAPYELGERLASEVRGLGVRGYTVTKADGWGKDGARKFGFVDGANLRFETLVSPKVARAPSAHRNAIRRRRRRGIRGRRGGSPHASFHLSARKAFVTPARRASLAPSAKRNHDEHEC